VLAFCQGVRDEKMLEKVATHDIMDVAELFSLVDKCARAAVGEPEAHRVTSAPAKHPVVMMAVPVRPVHNSVHHSVGECQEIKKLAE
jgi:bacterioferritin-associated ferredoxin